MSNTKIDDRALIELAYEARKHAYTPYSGFQVGAALMTKEGKVYFGCNIENLLLIHQLTVQSALLFSRLFQKEREFLAIAIVGGKAGTRTGDTCAPCGVCRQVMREFCEPKEFRVILEDGKGGILNLALEEILPLGFGPENLR